MIRTLAILSLAFIAAPVMAQTKEDSETRETTARIIQVCSVRGDQVRVEKGRGEQLIVRLSPTLTPAQTQCARGYERGAA